MRACFILLMLLCSLLIRAQDSPNPFRTVEPSLDSAAAVIVWRNLSIQPMDAAASSAGLPADYKSRIRGESTMPCVISSLSMITEKDLQYLQQKVGTSANWEIYIDVSDKFRKNYRSQTYYVWLKPAK